MSILSFLGGLVGIGPTRRTITISKVATNSGLPFVIGEARLKAISVFTIISRKNGPLGGATWDFKYDPRPGHGDEEVKGAREWLHRIDVFAQGPITGYVRFYVDSDAHTSARFGTRPYFRTVGYFGSTTQLAFAWGAVTTKRGALHQGVGVAYAISRFYAHGKYPKYNSEPLVEAVLQGMALYDPRPAAAQTEGLESSYTFSENPSLGLLRYLTADTGADWGFPALDVDSFKVAADFCDVAITIPARLTNTTGATLSWRNHRKGFFENVLDGAELPTNRRNQTGTTQPRIKGSFILDPEAGIKDNIETILTVVHGHLPFSNGKYKLIIEDTVGSAAMAFDDDSILGNWKVADGGRKDRLNRATVTFINKNKSYKEDSVSWPKLDSATYTTLLAEDSGEKLHQTFDVSGIPDYYQAEDWAEFQVRNSRSNKRVIVDLAPKAMVLEFGDVISLTSTARDYTAKWFRVRKVTLKVDGTVTADLVEYDGTIYSWSTKTVEPLDDPGDAPFVWDDPIALTSLATTAFHDVNDDGSVVSGFDVSWDAPVDTAGLEHIEVAWKLIIDLEYTRIMRVLPENTTARITGLADARAYDIRVTYRTSLGQISVSAEQTNKTLTASGSRLGGIEDGATAGAILDENLLKAIGGGLHVVVPQSDLLNSAISFPNLTFLFGGSGIVTASGNALEKTSVTSGWDAAAYTKEGFISSAALSFQIGALASNILAGMSVDPAVSPDYSNFDYSWNIKGSGTLECRVLNSVVFTPVGSYAVGDELKIIDDGINIKWYWNKALQHSLARHHSTSDALYFDSTFYSQNASITNIAFGQGSTVLGDPFGATENLLGVNAGPAHDYPYSYYNTALIADLGLAIGDFISFSALFTSTEASTSNLGVRIQFFEADDTLISAAVGSIDGDGVFTDFEDAIENVEIPLLTVKIRLYFSRSAGVTGQMSARNAMLVRGIRAMKFVKPVWSAFDKWTRFVDNERMPMLRNYSFGTSRTANPLTASDAGATATISIAAHTVYNGDTTGRTYNAGSITGLAFSTGYAVWVDDPDYDAGSVTYAASTTGVDAGKNLGRYLVGSVTTPTDGSPPETGGGGGGFDCIAVGMWLTDTLQAKDLKPSSTLMFLTEIEGIANGGTYYEGHLESVDFSDQPCVEIETTGGAKLICSVSTPVTLRSGALIPVTECLGGDLATLIDGKFEWQEVIHIEHVGKWPVAHVHAGGRTFAAGREASARIFTHNALKL